MAEKKRYEFLTPELVLYCICMQTEMQLYCIGNNIPLHEMMTALKEYNEQQDLVPEDEEFQCFPSMDFVCLGQSILQEYETSDHTPVSVATALSIMQDMDDSIVQDVLNRYFADDAEDWVDGVSQAYCFEPQEESAEPTIMAEAFINGKRVHLGSIDGLGKEELFGKMMLSAGRLVGALQSIEQMRQRSGEKDSSKSSGSQSRAQREPWEDLVTNVTETYQHHNPLVGRTAELERAIRVLCRKDKNNPLFIGESGVGKTAMIYGLAQLIAEDKVPVWLQNHQIYALDMGVMVAGASYHGEFERRMKTVLEGVKAKGNGIIYIDEIHTIMGAGGGGHEGMNAADMLKPYLEDGSIRFIGCTSYQDFNKKMANAKAVVRRFQTIDVKEPSVAETLEIIQGVIPNYAAYHHVRYDEEAVRYAVEQSDALIHDRFLPDKAIDLLDEAGAYRQQHPLFNKKGERMSEGRQKVDKTVIRKVLTEVCRIDAKALMEDDNVRNESLRGLSDRITADIYGQDEAVRQVVRAVMMAKAGLSDTEKPMASLLFVGPTGVGKTEVCKVLARELGIELVRFDMSEYTEKHTISKLIGSPAGYVGFEEGGLLTDAIRKTPNCVLLLDEIEKAHSDIYNILLQVMDYARLTDNKGNKADFRNVILVMTSNAGAQFAAQAGIGFSGGQTKGQSMLATVKKTFKPEFLNRLSGTVVFNEMDRHMASLILDKKLRQLQQRLAAKAVTLTLTDEAHQFLLDEGFTTQYGAREMDRVISQHLTPLLMEEILFGRLASGGDATVRREESGLKLSV